MDTTFIMGVPDADNGAQSANSSTNSYSTAAGEVETERTEQQAMPPSVLQQQQQQSPQVNTNSSGPMETDLTRTHPRPTNHGAAARYIDSRGGDDFVDMKNDIYSARRQRTRQQTQTIEAEVIVAVKNAFDSARQGSESAGLAEVESRVLALLQAREQEWNRRIHEAERASSNQAGCNAMDVMCYNQLLYEMGCMLDELTGGDYVHSSRARDPMSSIGPIGNDVKKLAEEKEMLRRELDDLHEDYTKVYDTNSRLRKNLAQKDEDVNMLNERCKMIHNERLKMKEKYERLRDNASKELTRASQEYENLKKKQEEDTVGLRLKVKTLQMSSDALTHELDIKKKEITDLRHIIDELMSNVEVTSEVDPNESTL
ncbi:hypothetical protein WR25_06538 [Diploscapter pachys]|uniref:Transforming acidic coiled-coil-containing protein C-terminal domain-containing protein n=1 Tax=Diploscapter pachys TaxID=2018661 RepID=A0A2A2LVW3_9BILA|nr:hypothetical protein WR25_06538 [Diploscapter pachys]